MIPNTARRLLSTIKSASKDTSPRNIVLNSNALFARDLILNVSNKKIKKIRKLKITLAKLELSRKYRERSQITAICPKKNLEGMNAIFFSQLLQSQ